jgi:hypothetical protein
MRVSKTFYQVAGPLLYSNIVVNAKHSITPVLVGNSVVHRDATPEQAAAANLKNGLLSLIKLVTIFEHGCSREAFTGPLLRIPTLLVVPRASCDDSHHLCLGRLSCPIIAKIRPQKVVLHNTRVRDYAEAPNMDEIISKHFPFTARCPTLTLVLDEMGCDDVTLEREASYPQVNLDFLKEMRVIVHKTPKWLDRIAQRSTCSLEEATSTIAELASQMLGPVITPIVALGSLAITIYLFRQLDPASTSALTAAIEADLSKRQQAAGPDLVQEGRPRYTIKTLSDYISEGLDDELLPEELEYWREQKQKRLAEGEAVEEKAAAVSLSGSRFVTFSSSSLCMH